MLTEGDMKATNSSFLTNKTICGSGENRPYLV